MTVTKENEIFKSAEEVLGKDWQVLEEQLA